MGGLIRLPLGWKRDSYELLSASRYVPDLVSFRVCSSALPFCACHSFFTLWLRGRWRRTAHLHRDDTSGHFRVYSGRSGLVRSRPSTRQEVPTAALCVEPDAASSKNQRSSSMSLNPARDSIAILRDIILRLEKTENPALDSAMKVNLIRLLLDHIAELDAVMSDGSSLPAASE